MTERIFDAVLCIILIGIAVYCVYGVRKAGDLRHFLWITDDEVDDYKELAEYVCDLDRMCSGCPGNGLCVSGGGHANGMIKWLLAEAEDDE